MKNAASMLVVTIVLGFGLAGCSDKDGDEAMEEGKSKTEQAAGQMGQMEGAQDAASDRSGQAASDEGDMMQDLGESDMEQDSGDAENSTPDNTPQD